jgi:hypothetical protein
MFVVPAVRLGANPNGSEHALPFGPEVIENGGEDTSADGLPDHGANDPLVV